MELGIKNIVESKKRSFFSDPSFWLLIVTNLATIVLAIVQNWDISTVMWTYWSQSMIIALVNVMRMLALKNPSMKGIKINGKSAEARKYSKVSGAVFFLVHYGGFHLIYAMFLFMYGLPDMNIVLYASGIFLLNHLFSYFYNRARDEKNQSFAEIMVRPYSRIIPMHISIIFGSLLGAGALPFFLVLKSIADAFSHVSEHRVKVSSVKEN